MDVLRILAQSSSKHPHTSHHECQKMDCALIECCLMENVFVLLGVWSHSTHTWIRTRARAHTHILPIAAVNTPELFRAVYPLG